VHLSGGATDGNTDKATRRAAVNDATAEDAADWECGKARRTSPAAIGILPKTG